MTEMRVLTVRQPWAWAIIHGGKDVENRVRNIAGAYRGPVAIHVAGAYAIAGLDLPALDEACELWCSANCTPTSTHPWLRDVGKIIGVVDLRATHHADFCTEADEHYKVCSVWAEPDAWHLELTNPRPLAEPIPLRGGLGLRRLDDVTQALVEAGSAR